jgi:hypothetical protein
LVHQRDGIAGAACKPEGEDDSERSPPPNPVLDRSGLHGFSAASHAAGNIRFAVRVEPF